MATITSKGQVTIPKSVRDRFGLGPGIEVEFEIVGNTVQIRRVTRQSSIDRWCGVLTVAGGTDAFLNEARGKP